jgi:hypothetical protein
MVRKRRMKDFSHFQKVDYLIDIINNLNIIIFVAKKIF